MLDVTLNAHREGRYQPNGTVHVSSVEEAIELLGALPGDILWAQPVGEDFKSDFRVEDSSDGLTLRSIS